MKKYSILWVGLIIVGRIQLNARSPFLLQEQKKRELSYRREEKKSVISQEKVVRKEFQVTGVIQFRDTERYIIQDKLSHKSYYLGEGISDPEIKLISVGKDWVKVSYLGENYKASFCSSLGEEG